jgi:hypothetical protein
MKRDLESIFNDIQTNMRQYNARVSQLRSDKLYTDVARADLLATAYETARDKHERLKRELREYLDGERVRLERAAFNAPRGEEQNYRDAISKASAITDKAERQRMFDLALKSGDQTLLQAMAAVSHADGNWNTVISAAHHDSAIADLVNFEKENGALRTAEDKFRANLMLSAPSRPREAQFAHVAGERISYTEE